MNMLDFDIKQLDEFIEIAKTDPEKALNDGYSFIKNIAHNYYDNGCMNDNYYKLLSKLGQLECKSLSYHNLLDFHYPFDTLHPPSREDVLEYIIWCGRKHLMYGDDPIEDLYQWDFKNLCYYGSWKIEETCRKLGIKCRVIKLIPGFSPRKKIPCKLNFHCFNIIEFESKYYLVDITLAQFFCGQDNHLGRLGVAGLEGPNVGCYMVRLKGGKELAKQLFTTGYVELDENTFKTYMDAFMLKFRNGLYYEENGVILPYSVDQYRMFLQGEDSQVKHEKVLCLGKQKRPLKNPCTSIFGKFE